MNKEQEMHLSFLRGHLSVTSVVPVAGLITQHLRRVIYFGKAIVYTRFSHKALHVS